MPNSRDTESLSPPAAKGWSAKRAFTLLELLIVMAVMGLMMGLIGFTLLGGGGEELGSAREKCLGSCSKPVPVPLFRGGNPIDHQCDGRRS